ncbi:MAG: hypothetical protein IJK02_00805 [Clostridia bacterium]|nr:hypothetical protein [Clostridia bacterium]
MNRRVKKAVSVVVSSVLLVGSVFAPVAYAESPVKAAAANVGSFFRQGLNDVFEFVVTSALSGVQRLIPDKTDAVAPEEYVSENFYSGTQTFLTEPAADARWQLGYAYRSLVPDDWRTHTYYLGGYIVADNGFTNNLESVIDDMAIRCVAVSDGSGRGVSLFGTIDAIGVSNKDIRAVRAMLAERAESAGIPISSVNLTSTHAHSCIDTQGLWTDLFRKVFKNIGAAIVRKDLTPGADEHYLSFMRQQVADALFEALTGMKTGSMTYSRKSLDKGYFSNKNRKSATSLPTELTRFLFTPDDGSMPTVISNLGAHPDVAGLPTDTNSGRDLCGEYVYYIGDELAAHGYNSLFINGAIAGIYFGRGLTGDGVTIEKRYQESERYGREIARILLAMNMTEEEIYASDLYDAETIEAEKADAASKGANYTLWCANWEPVPVRDVPAYFNIRLKEVRVSVTNPLILLAGKLKLANYNIIRDPKGNYSIYTEIGYAEFGDVPVVLVPGELVTDIYAGGGSLTAAGSSRGEDFGYPCLKEIFGADTVCFGLANDAIGYIVPDNDYKMAIIDDHYQELISLGRHTASTLMEGYLELAQELGIG